MPDVPGQPDEHRDHPPGRRATAVPSRNQGVWDAVGDLARQRQDELGRPLRVLDLGGGTGGLAVPLAELGHDVTVVDPSLNALAALERRAADVGVADRITGRQGDADSLADLTAPSTLTAPSARTAPSTLTAPSARTAPSGRTAPSTLTAPSGVGTPPDATGAAEDRSGRRSGYDLVCCHGVLEVVDDPAAALAGIAAVLEPEGHLSLLVAGRLAVVLARALSGDLVQARAALTSSDGRWGPGDPLPRRFDVAGLTEMLDEAGLTPVQVHGVRIFADLVPSVALDGAADRQALADLERAAATHPRYAEALGDLGSGLHAIALRP